MNKLILKYGKIENLKSGGLPDKPHSGSDQDFLNAYYPDWPKMNDLHIDHKYNMFHYYFDEYNRLFGYTFEGGPKIVSIVHYASYLKPWKIQEDDLKILSSNSEKKFELEAINRWLSVYKKIKL